jgi:hypothetical protein
VGSGAEQIQDENAHRDGPAARQEWARNAVQHRVQTVLYFVGLLLCSQSRTRGGAESVGKEMRYGTASGSF